jgi:hypothetical protein
MNKFEALKMFQAWPSEHQRLCAEYWAETDEGSDMRLAADRETLKKVEAAWTTADKIQTAGELVHRGVAMPSDQPKTVLTYPREIRRAERAKNMNPLKPWSIADDEALVKLHDTGIRRSEIIMRFMADHPYRTFNAVASRHDHLRRLDWKVQ